MEKTLPPIPAKRYFTIGEVSDLCGVKPHVLRYWEQEFTQLRPMKRRGNRRYYQHHEVLMIRRIRDLLYDQGFTISGARNKLQETVQSERDKRRNGEVMLDGIDVLEVTDSMFDELHSTADCPDFQDSAMHDHEHEMHSTSAESQQLQIVRRELSEIRDLLTYGF
ncbi:MAG: MerR family transcriptional regulator [Polaromonas sp.]